MKNLLKTAPLTDAQQQFLDYNPGADATYRQIADEHGTKSAETYLKIVMSPPELTTPRGTHSERLNPERVLAKLTPQWVEITDLIKRLGLSVNRTNRQRVANCVSKLVADQLLEKQQKSTGRKAYYRLPVESAPVTAPPASPPLAAEPPLKVWVDPTVIESPLPIKTAKPAGEKSSKTVRVPKEQVYEVVPGKWATASHIRDLLGLPNSRSLLSQLAVTLQRMAGAGEIEWVTWSNMTRYRRADRVEAAEATESVQEPIEPAVEVATVATEVIPEPTPNPSEPEQPVLESAPMTMTGKMLAALEQGPATRDQLFDRMQLPANQLTSLAGCLSNAIQRKHIVAVGWERNLKIYGLKGSEPSAETRLKQQLDRAEKVLAQLIEAGKPFMLQDFMQQSGLHRNWLYQHPEFRARLNQAKLKFDLEAESQRVEAQAVSVEAALPPVAVLIADSKAETDELVRIAYRYREIPAITGKGQMFLPRQRAQAICDLWNGTTGSWAEFWVEPVEH